MGFLDAWIKFASLAQLTQGGGTTYPIDGESCAN